MEKMAMDELRTMAVEAGFNTIDESEVFDVVFGMCDCCCLSGGTGNKPPREA